jgi:hypothetical protein
MTEYRYIKMLTRNRHTCQKRQCTMCGVRRRQVTGNKKVECRQAR